MKPRIELQANIADNLTQAADDMIAYVLKSSRTVEEQKQHKQELIDILKKVKEQYLKPESSSLIVATLESIVHIFTRQRLKELDDAIELMDKTDAGDVLIFLDIMTGILEKGGIEATSANTTLLNELIMKTNKYQLLEEDARMRAVSKHEDCSTVTIRNMLRDVFMKNSRKTIDEYKKVLDKKTAVQIQKPIVSEIKHLKLDSNFEQKLKQTFQGSVEERHQKVDKANEMRILEKPTKTINIIEDYSKPVRKKLDPNNFGNVFASLSGMFAAKKKEIQVPTAKQEIRFDKPDTDTVSFNEAKEQLQRLFKPATQGPKESTVKFQFLKLEEQEQVVNSPKANPF